MGFPQTPFLTPEEEAALDAADDEWIAEQQAKRVQEQQAQQTSDDEAHEPAEESAPE